MFKQGGYRQATWVPIEPHSNVPPAFGDTAIYPTFASPWRRLSGTLDPVWQCLGCVLVAVTLVVVALAGLQANWKDAIDQRARRLAERVQDNGQQIDAELQSSANLAKILANLPAEPGGAAAVRRILAETMEHAPGVFAIVLSDPASPPVSIIRRGLAEADEQMLPPPENFLELAPNRVWDGVTLLHLCETAHSLWLVGLRARAASGRQVTVYLRGQDLPTIGRLSARSWLFGRGRSLVAVPGGGSDIDAADIILQASEAGDVLLHNTKSTQANLPDGLHQIISSQLKLWPLILVADLGPAEPTDIAAVLSRFGAPLGLIICSAVLLTFCIIRLRHRITGIALDFAQPSLAPYGPSNVRLNGTPGAPVAASSRRLNRPHTPSWGRVLLVDDDDLVRQTIARRLRMIGYHVSEAATADQATILLEQTFDILVTDIVLHQAIDGWALAEMARKIDPNLPLVFMSGYLSARQPEVMASDELASFVRKPLQAAELNAVIEGLLALRETRRLSAA